MTFQPPLALALNDPARAELRLAHDADEVLLEYRLPSARRFQFGIGHEDARLWFGRISLAAARARTRVDATTAVPIETVLFDASDATVGSIEYGDLVEQGADGRAPRAISVRTDAFHFSASYLVDEIGRWHLDSASMQRAKDGGWEDLSRARAVDWHFGPEAPTPRQRPDEGGVKR